MDIRCVQIGGSNGPITQGEFIDEKDGLARVDVQGKWISGRAIQSYRKKSDD